MKKINIDILRLVAAFMIVAIHTYPLSFINDNTDYIFTRILFRIAVPFFLMITGYFILAKKDKNILIKYTKKLLLLYCASILLYLPINIYNGYFQQFNLFSLLKDIFLTGTFYHLWYFPALIIGLWISFLLITKLNIKKFLTIALILYIIGILGDNYYGLIVNVPIINLLYKGIFLLIDYTRNFFYMPIFLLMGCSLKNKELKIKRYKLYVITLSFTMLIEGLISLKFQLYRHNSMYLSLVPLMYLLFYYIINNSTSSKNIRSLGTYIYILHPLFIVIMHFILRIVKLAVLNNSFVNFLLVTLLTFTTSCILDYIIKKIHMYNSSKVPN